MKFELTDSKKQIPDLEIINDLRAVANNLGKKSLKIIDYNRKNGAKYNYQTAKKRFGNWETVLQKAGLGTEKSVHGIEYGKSSLNPDLLIQDMIRVSQELGKAAITIEDYEKYGKHGSATIQKHFGGWNNAKKKAGLAVERKYNTSIEEYFQNILELWTYYGRQPKYSEVVKPISKLHVSSYENKFGTWKAALKEFINYVNANDTNSYAKYGEGIIELSGNDITQNNKNKLDIKLKRTPRTINLRLRYIVLKRDNFSCKKCGQSPAKNPAVRLHVDHVIPWSKGGETLIENLEVLCEQCNLGKSNVLA